MHTKLETEDSSYEADLFRDDDGIWYATIWYISENGTAKNLLAVYMDVECPAVGDQFREAMR